MESDENDQLESHLKEDETLEKGGKLIFKINSPYWFSYVSLMIRDENLVEYLQIGFNMRTFYILYPFSLTMYQHWGSL